MKLRLSFLTVVDFTQIYNLYTYQDTPQTLFTFISGGDIQWLLTDLSDIGFVFMT